MSSHKPENSPPVTTLFRAIAPASFIARMTKASAYEDTENFQRLRRSARNEYVALQSPTMGEGQIPRLLQLVERNKGMPYTLDLLLLSLILAIALVGMVFWLFFSKG